MPDDRNDNNSQTPRDPKIPGMPGGKKPTRTGWLYFILACALLGYAFFNMGSGFANSSNTVKLATSEMVSAIKQDRVEDLTYTVQDGSVTGHYWKTKKDKGDTSEPRASPRPMSAPIRLPSSWRSIPIPSTSSTPTIPIFGATWR